MYRIVDEKKIPRRFLKPDETAIGQMVRERKSKELAEADCQGIEVWSE
jgi:hypothetical protein